MYNNRQAVAWCVSGAYHATGGRDVTLHLSPVIDDEIFTAAWNDAPGRTQADVVELLLCAASAARSDEEAAA
jgi:hypothetical protein